MLSATRRKATGADHKKEITHRCFHTQTLSHSNSFTHQHFDTATFAYKIFDINTLQTLLHTKAFRYRRLHTQSHRRLHTLAQTQLHTRLHTYTDTFVYKSFHRRFYTAAILHTDALTHRGFYTLTLLHTDDSPVGRHEVTTKKPNTRTKANPPTQHKTQQHNTKPPNRGVTGASSWAN